MILIERKEGAKPFNVSLENQVLLKPHLIKIEGSPKDIAEIERVGNDLIVTFTSGKKIIFYGFYNEDENGNHSELVFEDDDSQLYWLNGEEFLEVAADPALTSEIAVAGASDYDPPIWVLALMGAGILGGNISSLLFI